MWWHIHLFPAPRRQRQSNFCDFDFSLIYVLSSRSGVDRDSELKGKKEKERGGERKKEGTKEGRKEERKEGKKRKEGQEGRKEGTN